MASPMIEDWALRGMQRWPNVPALYGWLGLDRRGRWLIRGEQITRPQIIETIGRNYAADEQGRWYFQNGPQRGYVSLAYAPLVLHIADAGETMAAHTGRVVESIRQVFLDETGALLFDTDLGPGLLLDADLGWALERLRTDDVAVDDDALATAMALHSGQRTHLQFRLARQVLPVHRLDSCDAPDTLGFVTNPVAAAAEAT